MDDGIDTLTPCDSVGAIERIIDMAQEPTNDSDVDGVALFADVDPTDNAAVQARSQEWKELTDAS